MHKFRIFFVVLFSLFSGSAWANEGCFVDKTINDNIVYIVSTSVETGVEDQGTGFITSDHKIITARHIVDFDPDEIRIYWSNGDLMGHGSIVQGGNHHYEKDKSYIENDIATLNVSFNGKDQKVRYENASGLVIGNNKEIVRLAVDEEYGIADGLSGSPVLNKDNVVVGLLSASTRSNIKVDLNTIGGDHKVNPAYHGHVDSFFPGRNIAYIAPLGTVNASNVNIDLKTNESLMIYGYPSSYCLSYKTHVTNNDKYNVIMNRGSE